MIVIEVLGGVIHEVYSDDPETKVVVVDWDNEEPKGEGVVAGDYPTTPLSDAAPDLRREAERGRMQWWK